MPHRTHWTSADVLDLEALLHRDEQHGDSRALAARDARLWREEIAPALPPEAAADPGAILHAWLDARRRSEAPAMPGTWLVRGWKTLGGAAIALGLASGFIVANGALFYAGQAPVNVLVFLAVTVGVQWLMLLWGFFMALSRGTREASSRALVVIADQAARWLAAALEHLPGDERMRLRGEAAALRKLAGRNAGLLRWPPLIALQTFGVAWNTGVLAALLLRVLATDVAFGWETTLARGPEGMHAVAHSLATPWRWFAPSASPTLAEVEGSQFRHRDGMPSMDRRATAVWWTWLAGMVVVYGLLPRLLLLLWFAARERRTIRSVAFDEPRHKAAWRRIAGPVVQTEGSPHDDFAHGTVESGLAKARSPEPGCVLIASTLAALREPIVHWVSTQLGWQVMAVEEVQVDFPGGNDAALSRLAGVPRWIVAVPARFAAFAAFAQFLEALAGAAPPKAEGCVLVVGTSASTAAAPDEEWVRYWRDVMRAEAREVSVFGYRTP